jgi:hypothetical protein
MAYKILDLSRGEYVSFMTDYSQYVYKDYELCHTVINLLLFIRRNSDNPSRPEHFDIIEVEDVI